MIERFQGTTGRARYISALRNQRIVRDNEEIATKIADMAELRELDPSNPDDILTVDLLHKG